MTLTRAASLGLAALAGCAAFVITVPGQANAATAYRYWGYYVAHGTSWQYSQRGPAIEYPTDGEVQGWRFAVQADATNGQLPRAAPDFATLCASTPAKTGELRVGLVVDFGLATDAPTHERPPAAVVPGCVYVHDGATGADVLAAAAVVRIGTGSDAGLVCGIDGYPKTECAVAVATHVPPPTALPLTPSSHPPTAAVTAHREAVPSSLGPTVAASAAARSDAVSSQPAAPAPSNGRASAAAQVQSAGPVQAPASAVSLAALRASSRHGQGVAATTVVGIALIVALGGGALWRTRSRGR